MIQDLYVLLPKNGDSEEFVSKNAAAFLNIGGQCVCLVMQHPDEEENPDETVYQIEVLSNIYKNYEADFNALGAEPAYTEEEYLAKYPPQSDQE